MIDVVNNDIGGVTSTRKLLEGREDFLKRGARKSLCRVKASSRVVSGTAFKADINEEGLEFSTQFVGEIPMFRVQPVGECTDDDLDIVGVGVLGCRHDSEEE